MMTTLAYIVVGFGLLRLVIATLNLLLQEKLPRPKSGESLPSLSVLIPARNEAHNIEALLSDLTHVESESLLEIIVCDDASEDSTVELVDTWMQRDSRIRLIYSSGPPSGWLGKNHACHLLSREARGEYLLFLDADVRLSPAFIERALSYATTHRLGLLSLPETEYANLGRAGLCTQYAPDPTLAPPTPLGQAGWFLLSLSSQWTMYALRWSYLSTPPASRTV